ncbi:hypothetical protein E2C01_023488 [Portunus trituberculatus]|uniref:Uncharacterized protein n=1 Tax=Portunus trituberculatus TaxID=210409 RepID=A0A5B7E8Y5_PORTR|nr:hypothetical protein [Portunus trituberculatus]
MSSVGSSVVVLYGVVLCGAGMADNDDDFDDNNVSRIGVHPPLHPPRPLLAVPPPPSSTTQDLPVPLPPLDTHTARATQPAYQSAGYPSHSADETADQAYQHHHHPPHQYDHRYDAKQDHYPTSRNVPYRPHSGYHHHHHHQHQHQHQPHYDDSGEVQYSRQPSHYAPPQTPQSYPPPAQPYAPPAQYPPPYQSQFPVLQHHQFLDSQEVEFPVTQQTQFQGIQPARPVHALFSGVLQKHIPGVQRTQFPVTQAVQFPLTQAVQFPITAQSQFPVTQQVQFPVNQVAQFQQGLVPLVQQHQLLDSQEVVFPAVQQTQFPVLQQGQFGRTQAAAAAPQQGGLQGLAQAVLPFLAPALSQLGAPEQSSAQQVDDTGPGSDVTGSLLRGTPVTSDHILGSILNNALQFDSPTLDQSLLRDISFSLGSPTVSNASVDVNSEPERRSFLDTLFENPLVGMDVLSLLLDRSGEREQDEEKQAKNNGPPVFVFLGGTGSTPTTPAPSAQPANTQASPQLNQALLALALGRQAGLGSTNPLLSAASLINPTGLQSPLSPLAALNPSTLQNSQLLQQTQLLQSTELLGGSPLLRFARSLPSKTSHQLSLIQSLLPQKQRTKRKASNVASIPSASVRERRSAHPPPNTSPKASKTRGAELTAENSLST